MFDSLDDQMKRDDDKIHSPKQRMMIWSLYAVIGVAAMAGLFVVIGKFS